MNFQAETYGKWILAGEHAVLRGAPALVFPAKDFVMKFTYEKSAQPLQIQFEGASGADLKLFFWGLVEQALEKIGRSRAELTGYLKIHSTLPLGAGLGASAALCVGVVQFFTSLGWVKDGDVYELSRQLEGVFHGESSGVDIAVAIEKRGLRFLRGGERTPIEINWRPNLYLSYSGERGATSDCVRRVNELRAISPHIGDKVDQEMRDAVRLAESALQLDAVNGFTRLVEAITLAKNCFVQWGLTQGALDSHMQELLNAGAVAVKPTGSGGGGYVLSLWRDEPSPELQHRLVSVRPS